MACQSWTTDNDELIHDAVRHGHVMSLEIYLNRNPHCVNKLFTFNQSKWTPLLAACYYKHEHIVRMLLNRFKPDIEACGTVVFDMIGNQQEIVEDVSPLWTAVAVDHFDIVQLLIERAHANVNHVTKTHSTSFRVACYNNNIEMAKYLVEHGADPHHKKIGNYTNLMLSAGRRYFALVKYLVNEMKCVINEADENGQTALYYATKGGSCEIVNFLLECGALNTRDNLRKVTPLTRAALYGEVNLVDAFHGYCTDLEWIEAKELLGASFGGCVARFESLNKTIEYLTEAFQMRAEKNLPKVVPTEPCEIFDFRSECETLEQFNQLINSNMKEQLHIETIRIHQRILGDMSRDYHHVLRYYGVLLADSHRYNDCLRWWFYEVDLREKHKLGVKREHLRSFVDILLEMKQSGDANIPVASLTRILKIVDKELQSSPEYRNFDYNLHTLLYLLTLTAQMIFGSNSTTQQNGQTNDWPKLFSFIRTIVRHEYKTMQDQSTLLHLSTNSSTESYPDEIHYPCWMTAHLLLSCGANVDALDSSKNTSLHIIAQNESIDNVVPAIDVLHNYGAHLDYVNTDGLIPLELIPAYNDDVVLHVKRKMGVRRLKCICAHVVHQNHTAYDKYLSTFLADFVEKH